MLSPVSPAALLFLLLLLVSSKADTSGKPCFCSAALPAGLKVNCSSFNLMELPHLPTDTTELHVQDSQIMSLPPGLFDRLVNLRKVSFSGNTFHCDCRIQYLRNWLLRNRDVVLKEPVCSSPASVAQKAITELTHDFFASCTITTCADGTYNTIMAVMLFCLIVLLLWSFILARKSTFTLYIDERHSGFEADSLRSLKPKHRRRLHTGLSEISSDSDYIPLTEDLEKPLVNMELLPQVLDVLQKKHNIKIKAT